MGFFELFKSRNRKELESHIADLITLSKADGNVHPQETKVILGIAKSHGMSVGEVKNFISGNFQSADIVNPTDPKKKLEYIFDLILIVKADRVVTDDELYTCKKIANSMGIDDNHFDEIYEMMNGLMLVYSNRDQIVTLAYNFFGDSL